MMREGHDEKVRLIQAKEIVSGHQQDVSNGGGAHQQMLRAQERNAMLEERLAEADELIA